MMRALFSGVTGLRSHQTRMDVIGNNIANVNTVGYKKSTVTFADLYSETISPSSAPSGNLGGTNAKQIGLGTSVGSIAIKHTAGAAEYRGDPLSVAIEGDGYFVVRTPNGLRYTRAGNFNLSSIGSLLDSSGNFVQAFAAEYKDGNNPSTRESGFDTAVTTYYNTFDYDSTNISPTVRSGVYEFEVDTSALGKVKLIRNGELTGDSYDVTNDGDGTFTIDMGELGLITFNTSEPGTDGYPGPDKDVNYANDLAKALNYVKIEVSNNDGFVPTGDYGDITIDPNTYWNVSIDEQGAVVGQLLVDLPEDAATNRPAMVAGEKVTLGYITLARFTNPEGLEKEGDNLYAATMNSGTPSYVQPGSQGVGSLSPSSLEMSNVDLSEEMVNMIITQRGFQANSRIITTTDTMLEELVNLKR